MASRTISRMVEGKCSQCGYFGDHDIVAMHADGIGFCFGMECPACGKLVPESAWHKYQKTGDVIIPSIRNQRIFKKDSQQSFPRGSRHPV